MISGLQKMTLLDFPGKVACTVFLKGCNFRCPFCHNSHLFTEKAETIMENEEFFAFLKSRKGLLDGVCVSGGEPTLYEMLPDFLKEILFFCTHFFKAERQAIKPAFISFVKFTQNLKIDSRNHNRNRSSKSLPFRSICIAERNNRPSYPS